MLPQWEKADQQSQLRHPTRSMDQDDETSTRLECSRLRSSGNVGMWMEKNERRRQRLSCLGVAVTHHHPTGPTRCFFGGRIEPTVTHRETGEDVHYDDFTSFYPCINKTRPYPTNWDRISRNQSNRMGSSRLYDVWSHPMQSSSIPRFVSPRTTHKRSWHASVSPSTKSNSPNHGTTATTCIHTRTLNAHSQEHGHGGVRNSSWHSSKVTKSMKYETWHFEPHSFQRVYQHSY